LNLEWFNGATSVSNVVSISNGGFGFNKNATDQWQTIIIPVSGWTFSATTANRLRITFKKGGSSLIGSPFYLDYIRLGGACIQQPPTTAGSYINNQTNTQKNANFNIDGNGTIGGLLKLPSYDSTTRNDGALTKALGTDEFGNVILGTVAGRQTLQQTFDTEVGGSILTKNDTARLGSTNLRFHTTGGFNNGIYMYENDSNYTIIKKSRIQLWASGRQFPDIHFYGPSLAGGGMSEKMGFGYDDLRDIYSNGHNYIDFRDGSDFYIERNSTARTVYHWNGPTQFGISDNVVVQPAGPFVKDNGKKFQVYGVTWLDDTVFVNKSIVSSSSSDSILVKTAGASGYFALIPRSAFITSITADNGLTASTSTNVQLGGVIGSPSALLHDSYINTTASFFLQLSGSATYVFKGLNTGSGYGVYGEGTIGTAGYNVTSGGTGVYGQTADGFGVYGAATTNGIGVRGGSASGYGSYSLSASGIAIGGESDDPSTSTVVTLLNLIRATSGGGGAGANGIGSSINFKTATTTSSQVANQLISKLTDATDATYTSQFIITGVNSAVTADLFTLSGSGATKLNKYGVGTFTGTPAYTLQVDASGNVIEGAASISGITADNGLTASTSTNVQLGGTLTAPTTIAGGSSNTLSITGSGTGNTLYVTNTSSGTAIGIDATSGAGLNSFSSSGTAILGSSSTGTAAYFSSGGSFVLESVATNGLAAHLKTDNASTNTQLEVLRIERDANGVTAANGIGGYISYFIEDNGGVTETTRLISKLTDATDATRTSQFIITGVTSATTQDWLTIGQSGYLKVRPMTVTEAGALTPAEGMLVFVSNTNGTFTSIGLWDYENGAWHKL
jgi:hypothetical protein